MNTPSICAGSQAQASATRFHYAPEPNRAVKRTPTLAMPAAFSWPVLVPSTRCAPSGAAYLGR